MGGGQLGSGDIKQRGKRTHGHGQQCGYGGAVATRRINGNGKNIIQNNFF